MGHDHHEMKMVPRGVLYGAAALILFTMVLTGVGQKTEMGTVRVPEGDVAYQVEVHFEDLGADGVEVVEASTGEVITTVPTGQDGFIRGVLRGLDRIRKLESLDQEAPYRLTRWSDGRMSITDTITEERVELRGFGQTNLEAFARLIAAAEERS
jgi:putative photosynthetic complex assembly protein